MAAGARSTTACRRNRGDNQRVETTESWRDVFSNRSLATSFDAQAALYARLRPEYPTVAVDLAVPAGAKRVLDLGAGTGKLTGSLLGRGLQVLAVEPLGAMLAELRHGHPRALAIAGTAESIPLDDEGVDAVLVGQAFHWFDQARALPEIARVLRPAGTLSLLWNHDDENDPMVFDIETALNRAGRPNGGSTGRRACDTGAESSEAAAPFSGHPSLTDPVLHAVSWTREQSVDDYLGLQQTYSYVIRASDSVRAALAAEVREIVQQYQPDAPVVRIPVTCQVWTSRRR